MRAYHGEPDLKAKFIELIEWHRTSDKLIQGHGYWLGGRGCAVGCSIRSLNQIQGTKHNPADHGAYESLIGVPRILASLEDSIFEGLPPQEAQMWPTRFADAIQEGADLSLVWPKFAVWLLVDSEHGVIRFAKNDTQRAVIRHVADLYQQTVDGETITISDWQSVRSAADAAYAAYAAADADAAAYAAAAAYADAATATAYAADATAYAADAARQQARIAQADKLIELLKSA